MTATKTDWPHIDSRVRYVGLTYIRRLNATTLANLDSLLVVQNFDQPLAVIVPYRWFLELQEQAKGTLPQPEERSKDE